MTAAPPQAAPHWPGDFRRLWDLAERWSGDFRRRGAAAEIRALLGEISAARRDGPDLLFGSASGDSIPAIRDAALFTAMELYGLDAVLAVEEIGAIQALHDTSAGRFRAEFRVRCLNYCEVEK